MFFIILSVVATYLIATSLIWSYEIAKDWETEGVITIGDMLYLFILPPLFLAIIFISITEWLDETWLFNVEIMRKEK